MRFLAGIRKYMTRRRRLARAAKRLCELIDSQPPNRFDMTDEEHEIYMATARRIEAGYRRLRRVGQRWGMTP